MDILRFCIILLLVIGLVPLASAEIVHTHSLSGTSDESNTSEYVYNGIVTDEITSNSTEGVGMWFVWTVETTFDKATFTYRQDNGLYDYDDLNKCDVDGNWIIEVYEVNDNVDIIIDENTGNITLITENLAASSSTDFTVSPLPEFTFGSLIAMLFAGAIYLMIRRNVDRSANVN